MKISQSQVMISIFVQCTAPSLFQYSLGVLRLLLSRLHRRQAFAVLHPLHLWLLHLARLPLQLSRARCVLPQRPRRGLDTAPAGVDGGNQPVCQLLIYINGVLICFYVMTSNVARHGVICWMSTLVFRLTHSLCDSQMTLILSLMFHA